MNGPVNIPKRTVGILLFDGVELLDFAGPYEVFSAARPVSDSNERLLEVFTVSEMEGPIICRNGLVVIPTYSLTTAPPAHLLVIPGGPGIHLARREPTIIEWVHDNSFQAEMVTSVCTGSFLLAEAGLLDGQSATTHWGSVERLSREYPDVIVKQESRWVDSGKFITSAGVSAGIDMSLHVLDRIYGPDVALATARGIEYDYWPLSHA